MKKVFISACCYMFIHLAATAQTELPAVKIKNLNGSEISFQSLVKSNMDTALIVSFWATWCIPCLNELENINDQYAERKKEIPFKLIAVSVDDARTSSKVKTLAKGKGWKFDVYTDVNNDLKRAFNVNDVPHLLIIKQGKIVYQQTGYTAGSEDELFEKIKTL